MKKNLFSFVHVLGASPLHGALNTSRVETSPVPAQSPFPDRPGMQDFSREALLTP